MILPWWFKPAVCIGLALLLALVGKWAVNSIEQSGYDRAVNERRAAEALHLDAETKRARKNEIALQDQLYNAAIARHEDKLKHENQLASLRAAALAGTERLRCPAARIHANPAPADTAIASGLGSEARSGELMSGTAADLFRIAGSIAEGVRRENALIDAYAAARATCNAP